MKNNRDFTKGSVVKNILLLAYPIIIANVLHASFNIVDTIFVGRISPEAIAAVSLVFPVVFFMFALSGGLGIGVTSLIARYLGSKKKELANRTAEHSFLIAAGLTLLFTTAGLLFGRHVFILMGASNTVLELTLQYVNIIFAGSIFMFFGIAADSILKGEGDTKTPMKMMVLAFAINIILDPILIFGWFGFPAMGIKGAATATVFSRAVASFLMFFYVFKNKALVQINLRKFAFNLSIFREIFRVGVPASLMQTSMAVGLFFLNKIASLFGPMAIAAYGLGFRLESVVLLPGFGIATAIITIVGFNVGAKNFARAEESVWKASKLMFIYMFCFGLVFFFFPEPWIRIFTDNPKVIQYGVSYLRVISLTYGLIGVSITIGSAFHGSGHPAPSLAITILRLFILAVPLAYILSRISELGVTGIWIGIAVSSIISFFVSVIWFRLGTWKKATI